MTICMKHQLLDSWRFPTVMDMMTLLLVTPRYKHMEIKPTVMKKAMDTDMGMMMDMENQRTVIKMMRAAVAGVVVSTMMWHA